MSNQPQIPTPVKETVKLNGEDITIELNHYAYKADAAITVQKGETVILATVTCSKQDIQQNFMPLGVEYIEKYYAGGIISSSRFVKREMRPSDSATLKARQVDHAIRSLFPKDWRRETGVVITVLAYDGENDPEQLAVIGASTALMLSSVPFAGPSASIKVGQTHSGEIVWSPKVSQEEELNMDMIFAVVGDRILNMEGWATEISEEIMEKLMNESVEKLQPILEWQKEIAKKYGKSKIEFAPKQDPKVLIDKVYSEYHDQIEHALLNRETRIDEINAVKAAIAESDEEIDTGDIETAVEYVARKIMRAMVLEEKRTSGRDLNEIRPLKLEVGVLPRVHGSAVFTRGNTQCLSVVTLGSTRMAQTLESFQGELEKTFMHHYSSPNYSYGDAGRFSYYPGRREIGHGNIGENALRKMLPPTDVFPYTVRVSSEIMSSNGSTSMAATCAASLALMDSGVKLKAMVAGVALGVVTADDDLNNFKILTDIEDVEDFYGDMDFKVAGSRDGITAIQMDNKLMGVPINILVAAFKRSREARLEILEKMYTLIPEPRAELSEHAPKVEIVKINPEKIGELIGPGGKNIRGIIEECENNVEIDIQENGDVFVMAINSEYRNKALAMINEMVAEPEVGTVYSAVVDKITEYGMFVQISPKMGGLVHVSELSNDFVKNVEDLYKVGDKVQVKLIGIDDAGRLRLSAKQAEQLPKAV